MILKTKPDSFLFQIICQQTCSVMHRSFNLGKHQLILYLGWQNVFVMVSLDLILLTIRRKLPQICAFDFQISAQILEKPSLEFPYHTSMLSLSNVTICRFFDFTVHGSAGEARTVCCMPRAKEKSIDRDSWVTILVMVILSLFIYIDGNYITRMRILACTG